MSKSELIVVNKPKSTISEDIRTLRTNLDFSLSANDQKIIMITSSNPSEGKSFISSNLSICFAQNDKKIDCVAFEKTAKTLHCNCEFAHCFTSKLPRLWSQSIAIIPKSIKFFRRG